jgi:hypothetical protein
MPGFTPTLRLPSLKKKNLTTNFHGIKAPFYVPTEVMPEGCPVKFTSGNPREKIQKAVAGDGAVCIGFALQEVYDDSLLDQLAGYHFPNDTRQKLDGMPIGVLMGTGWMETRYYKGTVAAGQSVYISTDASKLVGSGGDAVSGNKIAKAVFEGAGTDGDKPVRVAFDLATVL